MSAAAEEAAAATTAEAAAEYEAKIAAEALALRAEHDGPMDVRLLEALWPLLKMPIPAAYIQKIGAVKGKPYESTGIRSVQVQIDRMNNVLGPAAWWEEITYERDGVLCEVTVYVGNPDIERALTALVARSSRGGVNQGSTIGNIYKGSYTNAAKRAFAALGVGHEVYLGTADLDPDVNPDVAAASSEEVPQVGNAIAKKIVDRAWQVPEAKGQLALAIAYATEREAGDCSTKAKATAEVAKLTPSQAERVSAWVANKEQGGRK